jgi:hypothetical protein
MGRYTWYLVTCNKLSQQVLAVGVSLETFLLLLLQYKLNRVAKVEVNLDQP